MRQVLLFLLTLLPAFAASPANRLTYLAEDNPFYVNGNFPKLVTPQWVGDPNVEAVVTLGVDDMRASDPYEKFLRPLLERLKKIDGRAPVSIFSVAPTPSDPRLTNWLAEGLSLEVHTLTHPCPILAKSNFTAAATTFFSGIDLLSTIPGNRPVAFRTPCCDSINSASPRLFAELMCGVGPDGKFLTMDSSVVNLFTEGNPTDSKGRPRFTKYVPFPSFKTTIENYPFPYVINNLLWEMPFPAPSDWESHNIQGDFNPQFVEDWNKALDLTLAKRGIFNTVFHPHGWSSSTQLVAFVDHAVSLGKVKFLNYPEVQSRLNKNLLAGQPLRNAAGADNGVRLLDLNNDGFLDVVVGNNEMRRTRIWNDRQSRWTDTEFPALVTNCVFGIVRNDAVSILTKDAAWTFDGAKWKEDKDLRNGLTVVPQGARLRDIDNDGVCELIVSNPAQNEILAWDEKLRRWSPLPFTLPKGTSLVNKDGLDNGLRFIDINDDGYDDVIFSNEERYSLHLYIPKWILGFERGWTRQVSAGLRADADAIPAFVRPGPNRHNGAWFHSKTLWVQNEDTAHLPDLVDRRTFADLLVGKKPGPKSPEEALKTFLLPEGFKIEAVATEPLVVDPVAFEWDAKGDLYVVEMRDYPLGVDGKPGGVIKLLRDLDGDGKFDKAFEFLTNVNYPSGVMPWRNGALISAAPDLIYTEDTNNDGVADIRKVLVTGFAEGNQQHRFNGFEFGMDGWVYGANGDSGGTLKVLAGVLNNSRVLSDSIRFRGDFRFQPDTGELETIEGTTQFGRRRDDWDNWFGNNNSFWLWHYYLPARYVERNPNLRVSDLRVMTPENTILFPPAKTQQRFNDIGKGNTASAANSPTPYRDELFGPEFANSVFVSDPSFNLIHREILEADGVSFKSHRAASERDREFLTSTDNWFRPTMLKVGPDGALYVADMYRFVLEHPEWIPLDVQKAIDLRAGSDKGRIWRIYPSNVALRPFKTPDTPDSPNGWQRDTFHKLALWNQEKPNLTALIRQSNNPKARAQALWITRNKEDILIGLKDSDPRVRRQAVRVAEELDLWAEIVPLAGDPDITVSFQAVLALGKFKDPNLAKPILAAARAHIDDRRFLNSVLTTAPAVNLLAALDPKVPADLRLAVELGAEQPEWRAAAKTIALDTKVADADRAYAVPLLNDPNDLRQLLKTSFQSKALAQLAKLRAPETPNVILSSWTDASPSSRQEFLNILFSRPEWTEKLLAAIEKSAIPANAIDARRQQTLRENPKFSARAKKLFGPTEANRAKVLQQYSSVASLIGDPANGLNLFKQNCAQCHKFRGEGASVGPDLASVADKPFEYLLAALLDPNQAVEARYLTATAQTKDGSEFTGIITSETANNVTLTAANDLKQTFLRKDLKDLKISSRSLMPEGLETGLSAQAIADLISFLKLEKQ